MFTFWYKNYYSLIWFKAKIFSRIKLFYSIFWIFADFLISLLEKVIDNFNLNNMFLKWNWWDKKINKSKIILRIKSQLIFNWKSLRI